MTAQIPKLGSNLRQRGAITILIGLWLPGLVIGFTLLNAYSNRAGEQGKVAESWPENAAIQRDLNTANLVLFMHPKCPCSHATLAELAKVLSAHKQDLTVHSLFLLPRNQPREWAQTRLYERAHEVIGTLPNLDFAAVETQKFGARTSGHIMLFSKSGELQFSGGITLSRNHEGDNQGAISLLASLRGRPCEQTTFPVFGCPIVPSVSSSSEDM